MKIPSIFLKIHSQSLTPFPVACSLQLQSSKNLMHFAIHSNQNDMSYSDTIATIILFKWQLQ